nr:hypothetical protein [uncultured Lachnoanaerobaculum sp.]
MDNGKSGRYYSSENDINEFKSKGLENKCEKESGIDIRGINEEVDCIRKENKI